MSRLRRASGKQERWKEKRRQRLFDGAPFSRSCASNHAHFFTRNEGRSRALSLARASPSNRSTSKHLPSIVDAKKKHSLASSSNEEKTNALLDDEVFVSRFPPPLPSCVFTHVMTPLFRSAPRVTLASTTCTAAAVSHDIGFLK